MILGLEEGQHRFLSNLTKISIADVCRRPPKSRNISHLDGPPKYCDNMFNICTKPYHKIETCGTLALTTRRECTRYKRSKASGRFEMGHGQWQRTTDNSKPTNRSTSEHRRCRLCPTSSKVHCAQHAQRVSKQISSRAEAPRMGHGCTQHTKLSVAGSAHRLWTMLPFALVQHDAVVTATGEAPSRLR